MGNAWGPFWENSEVLYGRQGCAFCDDQTLENTALAFTPPKPKPLVRT